MPPAPEPPKAEQATATPGPQPSREARVRPSRRPRCQSLDPRPRPSIAAEAQAPPRRPIPGALKGIAALVAIAIVFIVAAVIGGSGGAKSDSESAGPAPAPAPAPAADGAPTEPDEAQSTEALGYPSFATGNTTRVGGSDPATNAAGVALAVFPSTTAAQRPAAVTLVGEDDWAGAIAAAVLMSAPVRAPVLISGADGLPDPTAEALEALDPQGDKVDRRRHRLRDRRRGDAGRRQDEGRQSRQRRDDGGGDRRTARRPLRLRPRPHPHRPLRPARAGDAGRRLGRPLRRPGPLRRRRRAAGSHPRRAQAPQESPGLRARPLLGDLLESAGGDRQGLRRASSASPARTRSPTRSPSPATPTAASAGTSTTPATASSSSATTRRSTPPSRRRSRPPAPGARCCSPTAPLRCRRRCVNTSST